MYIGVMFCKNAEVTTVTQDGVIFLRHPIRCILTLLGILK
jgi:hypothetical protein